MFWKNEEQKRAEELEKFDKRVREAEQRREHLENRVEKMRELFDIECDNVLRAEELKEMERKIQRREFAKPKVTEQPKEEVRRRK